MTGFLEQTEEPAAAVEREIREELGLHSDRTNWIGEFAYPEQNQILLAYAVECKGDIVLSEEISEVKLIELDALKPWAFGTGKAVKAWLDQRTTQ